MSVRSCRVTITDLEGISHTAEVTASPLFEAVALGLAVLRGTTAKFETGQSLPL